MSKPTPPPADGIRQRPKVGPTRCPYCHDDCLASDSATCVCGDCLSRHHVACWEEAAGCGSCRSQHRLQTVMPPATGGEAARAPVDQTSAHAEVEGAQAKEAGESEAVPLEFGPGGEIVIRGRIGGEIGNGIGSEVETGDKFSTLFVVGNVLIALPLLWLVLQIWNSI